MIIMMTPYHTDPIPTTLPSPFLFHLTLIILATRSSLSHSIIPIHLAYSHLPSPLIAPSPPRLPSHWQNDRSVDPLRQCHLWFHLSYLLHIRHAIRSPSHHHLYDVSSGLGLIYRW